MFLIILSLSEWRSVMLSLRALFVFQRVFFFYLRLKEALELLSKMERIQLQFWPWKSQRFCEFIDDPKTLRSKLATTSKLVYIITFLLSPLFLFVKIFLTTLPRLFFFAKFWWGQIWWLTAQESLPVNRQPIGKAFSRAWDLGAEFFRLKRSEKKMDHRLNFFNLVNLPQLTSTCPTYSTAQSFVKKMLWNLKCIWSYLIPISGVGKFPVGGLCFERKKRCPSDPSTILSLLTSIGRSISFIHPTSFLGWRNLWMRFESLK